MRIKVVFKTGPCFSTKIENKSEISRYEDQSAFMVGEASVCEGKETKVAGGLLVLAKVPPC